MAHPTASDQKKYGLLHKFRMTSLLERYDHRAIWAVFVFANSLITIAILSLLAWLTGNTFIFPSLGPTALLLFMAPKAEAVQPRSALLGHAFGIACGYLALVITGLTTAGPVTEAGVDLARIIAASVALASTGALMILFRAPHAPAGATTLIIALGFITQPFDLFIIEVAVLLLVAQAFVINRLAGTASMSGVKYE